MAKKNLKYNVVKGQNLGFAVLIIIILTLIVINFGNITGKATAESKSKIKITVDPDIIRSRDTVWITVTPGAGINKGYFPNDIDIIDEDGKNVGQAAINGCGNYCRKEMTTSYILPDLKAGKEYFVRVLDWDTKEYVKAPFVVIQSYN